MQKRKLSAITNKKYYIDKSCIYTAGKKKVCNFYIHKLIINKKEDRNISFTVTLKSKKISETATIPIVYLHEPYGWLNYGFDISKFQVSVTKTLYDKYMLEIINCIIKNTPDEDSPCFIGWEFNNDKYYFNYFDDPTYYVDKDDDNLSKDYLIEYVKFVDYQISIPLISYMLLSTLCSLKFYGVTEPPKFIMSITGCNEKTRNHIALFYTNLYKRTNYLRKNDYTMFHIMEEDKLSDIKFKSICAKDCTVIAFNPNKRYYKNIWNLYCGCEDDNIQGMCLISQKSKKDIPFKTYNINLSENIKDDNIRNYFESEYCYTGEYKEDCLIQNIYKFIYEIKKQINNDKTYLNNKYKAYSENFCFTEENDSITPETLYSARYLNFAFDLYMEIMHGTVEKRSEEINVLCKKAKDIIVDLAIDSFPKKESLTKETLEKGKIICKSIDNYFKNNYNKSYIGYINRENKYINEIKVWCDENYIYIPKRTIDEILQLQNCQYKFTAEIKESLFLHDIIAREKTSNGNATYSIHIQKALCSYGCTKKRYIGFKRTSCKKNMLFENIETHISATIAGIVL